jgi:hypothetical protein
MRMTQPTPNADQLFPAAPAPATPAAPSVPAIPITDAAFQVGIPRSTAQLAGLRARRSELSNQLNSAADRRLNIAQRLRQGTAGGEDRAGLEARLRVIDDRIVQIERDLSITGAQLTAAPPELFASASSVPGRIAGIPPGGIVAMGLVGTVTVLAPMALASARLMWRRASRPAPPRANPESDARLARLETAVDAIALEIERVSEGQRFVTRLLSESSDAAPVFGRAREAAVPVSAPPRSALDSQ